MFNGSFLRVCRILQFVKKLDFAFLSLGGPRHGARVWCLGRVPKHRNQWQEVDGLLFSPQNTQLVHILSFHSQGVFPNSSFQQVRQPSIPSPVEEDTSKIRDTTGTVFIQAPSILLLVWRSIMFIGSFLRVCRILRFVKKIRFCLLQSRRTKAWCPGLVSRPSAKAQEPVARSRGLVIQLPKLSVGAYFELSFLG